LNYKTRQAASPALLLYCCIALGCFWLARRGYRSRELLFKRGTKDTNLANNPYLIWAQIIALFSLGIAMFIYASRYLSLIIAHH
jgi:hypothetical protein